MARFRKKPVEIEARQFVTNNDDGTCIREICEWVEDSELPVQISHDGTSIRIATLEGVMEANVGDWIIKGIKGEFYPCKPDIFAASYGPVHKLSGMVRNHNVVINNAVDVVRKASIGDQNFIKCLRGDDPNTTALRHAIVELGDALRDA